MKPTKIEWTEATWNPSIGCSKVSSGCKNCYAAVMARRLQVMGAAGYEDGFELTKREHILQLYFSGRKPPANVWLGVTVEHEKTKHRIDVLKTIDVSIRFVSIEPLIGDVGFLNLSDIHWVIVGGESGMSARPMNPEWAIKIQKQCADQKVAFFFKQWGTWGEDGVKRNKKMNGSSLSGKEWKEEPKVVFPCHNIPNRKLSIR